MLLINQPKQGEVLYVYLSVSKMIVNLMQIKEENGVQMHVYCTSWAVRGAEEGYLKAEKIAFAF